MNCKSTVEMLSAYLDRELPTQERDAIRAHLGDCDACRREERDLRALKGLLLGVRAPEPAPDFEARLMSCLREQTPDKPRFEIPRLRPLAWGQLGGLAAASCLAAFVALRAPQPTVETSHAQTPVVTVANNLDNDVDAQRSEAYFQGSDFSAGTPILMTASHGP